MPPFLRAERGGRMERDLVAHALDEEARADLRPLRVEHDGAGAAGGLGGLADAARGGPVGLVVAVREVQAGHGHADGQHLLQRLEVPAGRAHGAHELGHGPRPHALVDGRDELHLFSERQALRARVVLLGHLWCEGSGRKRCVKD